MNIEEFAKELKIKTPGNFSEDERSYIIDLKNSNDYGKAYTLLDNSPLLDLLDDNQVITEEGSSIMYEAKEEDYLVNLLADWEANQYQIVITRME